MQHALTFPMRPLETLVRSKRVFYLSENMWTFFNSDLRYPNTTAMERAMSLQLKENVYPV